MKERLDIRRFSLQEDYARASQFLTDCYRENENIVCWLPERLDDLLFRVDTLYQKERGMQASQDYIYLFEKEGEILGLLLPDGDSCCCCIKRGHEAIFSAMIELAEQMLWPLFEQRQDGTIDFLMLAHDSQKYQTEELERRGYIKDVAQDYDNMQRPMQTNYRISLPEGYHQVYGFGIDEHRKAKACHYGFHSEEDNGVLDGTFREGKLSYQSRKRSRYYADSFESLITAPDGDICSYCFCYVNRENGTAFFEPVCTREKYRNRGFCRQMLYGAINRLKEMGIERAYINSYDWRRRVYNSAGFETQDSVGFWRKKIWAGRKAERDYYAER